MNYFSIRQYAHIPNIYMYIVVSKQLRSNWEIKGTTTKNWLRSNMFEKLLDTWNHSFDGLNGEIVE